MQHVDHVQTVLLRVEVDCEVIASGVLERDRLNSPVRTLHPCRQMLGIDVVEHQVQRGVLAGDCLKRVQVLRVRIRRRVAKALSSQDLYL